VIINTESRMLSLEEVKVIVEEAHRVGKEANKYART
jgi:hypothetical protein